MVSDKEKLFLLLKEKKRREAKSNFISFCQYTDSNFTVSKFHEVYYKILDKFAKGEIKKLIVTCPPQHGKFLKRDTPVLTTLGWKDHGDLEVGDKVFGKGGKVVRVLGNSGIYIHPTVKVNFSGGESLIASREHLWEVLCDREKYRKRNQKHERKIEVLETQHLFDGQRRNPAIQACNPLQITDDIELPIDPYKLGCWLGDGTSTGNSLTVGHEDYEYFSQFTELISISTKNRRNPVYRCRFPDFPGASGLKELDLWKNKHIPAIYFTASHNQRLELLRGLMDTDGTCCKHRGQCEFTQKEGKLGREVYILMRTLGLKPRFSNYDMKLYGVSVGRKDRILVSKPNERIFNLPRKYNRQKYNNRIDGTRFFVESIDDNGLVEGNCITVEGGLYLAGDQLILTHNSHGTSRLLPPFILSQNPNAKIGLLSYNQVFVRGFGRDIKKNMRGVEYKQITATRLKEVGVITTDEAINTADAFETVGNDGLVKLVGRGGGITGTPLDYAILDDIFKGYSEAASPLIRDQAWNWYVSEVLTRLHNDSQQLVTFTRWDHDDLIGRLEEEQEVITAKSWDDLDDIPTGVWVKVNFPAIQDQEQSELDPRAEGEALWPERHDLASLEEKQRLHPHIWEALYQGNPTPSSGFLYHGFQTYEQIPKGQVKAYIDTADMGKDYLCAISYVQNGKKAYLTDVYYSDRGMEITEPATAKMLEEQSVRVCRVESNNGGRGFARAVDRLTPASVAITWFHQSKNKEARILTNSASVCASIIMPVDWERRWPKFASHVKMYKKDFRTNAHDDAADTLTGIIEDLDKADHGSRTSHKNIW